MPPSFYLLHGPDEFASAEFLDDLKAKLGDPSLASLNTTVFDGRTASLPDVRAICDTLPFLTARRLVIVDGWLTRLMARTEAAGDDTDDDSGDEATAEAEPAVPARGSAKEILKDLTAYLPSLPP